jgi:hypothetical protein
VAKGPVKRLLDLAVKEFPEVAETLGIATPRRTKAYAPTLAVKPDVVEPLAVRPQIAIRTKPSGIIAYHGSPHTFDRFDMSKIGTGEGAQAYGHGLYFAENEGVAKSYRDALKGKQSSGTDALATAMRYFNDAEGDVKRAMGNLRANIDGAWQRNGTPPRQMMDAMNILNMEPERVIGSMYQVRIDADPNDFLDYDAPLSVQPRAMKALRELDLSPIREGNRTRVMLERALQGAEQAEYPAKGQTLSIGLDTIFGNNSKPVSDFLNERGLRGVKYLDQDSRIVGDGSRNFVVFDDDLVNILKRYRDGGLAVKKKKKRRG